MKKNMFLNLIFIIIIFANSAFAAAEREMLTISDTNWTLIEVDPDSDGYVRFTIDQINTNKTNTQWSPINTITTTTSVIRQEESAFYQNIYVKNTNATTANPVYLSITRGTIENGSIAKSYMFDGNGNPISSLNGAINIHDADVHSTPVNEFFHRHTGVATTLSANSLAGATSITVTSATGFTIGNQIQIRNGVIETTFPVIKNIVGTTFTLDRPLDHAFSIGDDIEVITNNIVSTGTLAVPVSYKIMPDTDQTFHVKTATIVMVHTGAADDGKFGDATALPNGVVFRFHNGETGQNRTLAVWKINADIAADTGMVNYTDKAGGGNYGTNAEWQLAFKSGAIPKLRGANGDYLEALVQDTINLVSFKIKIHGHLEKQ